MLHYPKDSDSKNASSHFLFSFFLRVDQRDERLGDDSINGSAAITSLSGLYLMIPITGSLRQLGTSYLRNVASFPQFLVNLLQEELLSPNNSGVFR